MKITKRYSETYEITKENLGGRKMKGMQKCFVCGHRFEDEDHVNLAAVTGHKNVLVCDECEKRMWSE